MATLICIRLPEITSNVESHRKCSLSQGLLTNNKKIPFFYLSFRIGSSCEFHLKSWISVFFSLFIIIVSLRRMTEVNDRNSCWADRFAIKCLPRFFKRSFLFIYSRTFSWPFYLRYFRRKSMKGYNWTVSLLLRGFIDLFSIPIETDPINASTSMIILWQQECNMA